MEREVIEAALIREANQRHVTRILKIETEAALPKGENYLSIITRVRLTVVLGSGRIVKRSLILKDIPNEGKKIEMVKNMSVFKNETLMYTNVLREMEALMEEFQDTNDVLWGKLLHYVPYTSLLFEDLTASGFKMVRRQDNLDLDHGLLVVRSLGRFHGMCKVLQEKGVIAKDDYKPYTLVTDRTLINMFLCNGMNMMAKAMEKTWGPEWYEVAQKLKIPAEVITDRLVELGKVDESRFNVLNHGDCWSNNMMFKYDTENRPYTMRFVDLQICHYNSCCFDLTSVLYVCIRPAVRRENYKRLTQAYLTSLIGTLERFGYRGADAPTEQYLASELDRLSLFGYYALIGFHGPLIHEGTDAFDLDTALESEGSEGLSMESYIPDKVRKNLQEDILFATENIF